LGVGKRGNEEGKEMMGRGGGNETKEGGIKKPSFPRPGLPPPKSIPRPSKVTFIT